LIRQHYQQEDEAMITSKKDQPEQTQAEAKDKPETQAKDQEPKPKQHTEANDEPQQAKSYTKAVEDPETFETPVKVAHDDGTVTAEVQQDVPTSENPDVPQTDRPVGTPGGPRDMSLNYSPKGEDDEAAARRTRRRVEARAGVGSADNPDMPNTDRAIGEPGGPRDMGKPYSPS
jgi:hypothetical protein